MTVICLYQAISYTFESFSVVLTEQGFSTSAPTDILGQVFFVAKSFPVHCRMFKSTPGLYPLHASSTILLTVVINNAKCSPQDKTPHVENHCNGETWRENGIIPRCTGEQTCQIQTNQSCNNHYYSQVESDITKTLSSITIMSM